MAVLAGAVMAALLMTFALATSTSAAAQGLLGEELAGRMAVAIESYRRIERAGGWPEIPAGSALRRGDSGPHVATLRKRLALAGDLPADPGTAFDTAVEAAVHRFQVRHGLVPTGIVYQSTREVMNVPVSARIRELEENRARLDALRSREPAPRRVVINIPAFELEAVDQMGVALRSRVVVGKIESPTPQLEAEISSVTLAPYWHVPRSLVAKDLRSLLVTDPDYLERNRIRVFSIVDGLLVAMDRSVLDSALPSKGRLMFRQDPGPMNAMGLYRINMPNDQQILLHDTPEKEHFDHAIRTFSAGCVRVEQIGALVEWLLGNAARAAPGGPDGEAGSPRTRVERLESPVPVHIVYITAWVDDQGVVQFRPDIYHWHRRAQMQRLVARHATAVN